MVNYRRRGKQTGNNSFGSQIFLNVPCLVHFKTQKYFYKIIKQNVKKAIPEFKSKTKYINLGINPIERNYIE